MNKQLLRALDEYTWKPIKVTSKFLEPLVELKYQGCMYVCIYCICIPHFDRKDQMTAECATIYIIYKMKGTPKRIDES